MIVRAGQPLMRGAQLTPVLRNYAGPMRGLSIVRGGGSKRRGLGDDSRILADLQNDIGAYRNSGTPPDQAVAAISADLHSLCASFPNFNAVDGGSATCPDDLDSQIQQAVSAAYAGYTPPAPAVAAAPMAPAPVTSAPVQSNAPSSAVALVPQPAFNNTGIITQPTVVQSNAPGSGVVVPTNLNITNPIPAQSWLMSDSLIGSDGFEIPNWMVLAGTGLVGLFLFSGKR